MINVQIKDFQKEMVAKSGLKYPVLMVSKLNKNLVAIFSDQINGVVISGQGSMYKPLDRIGMNDSPESFIPFLGDVILSNTDIFEQPKNRAEWSPEILALVKEKGCKLKVENIIEAPEDHFFKMGIDFSGHEITPWYKQNDEFVINILKNGIKNCALDTCRCSRGSGYRCSYWTKGTKKVKLPK